MMKMTRQQSSRFTAPSWLKWSFLVGGILFIIALTLAVWVYAEANQDHTAGNERATQLALENTNMTSINEVNVYYGDQTVHIVEGSLSNGKPALVYVQLAEKKIVTIINSDEFLSLKEFKTQWKQECGECSFKNVKYALEESQPVFEITYVDEHNRYVFDYFKVNGEPFDQRFAFKQNE